jgi:hypothetical protein
MPSPAALTGILTVSLLANIAHELVGFIERKRLAAMKNPYTAFLLQRRASVYRLQREALAFTLKGEGITCSETQLVADLLGNNDPACFVNGNGQSHDTIIQWNPTNMKW